MKAWLCAVLAACCLVGADRVGAAPEGSAPPTVAILRTNAPFGVEIEASLRDSLARLGYREGQTLRLLPTVVVKPRIEDFAETAKAVAKVLEAQPDVVATIGTQPSVPAWKVLEPSGVPMVFAGVTFPVEGGLIEAYGRPTGKNLTGIGYSVSPRQRLALLREMFPDRQRFRTLAFAYSGQVLQDATYVKHLRRLGEEAGWALHYIDYFDYAQGNVSLRMLIDKLEAADPDVVFGWYDLDVLGNDAAAFHLLLDRLGKPLVSVTSKGVREGAVGGVMTDHAWLGAEQARMIDRILRGEPAGRIPPVEPATWLFELNLKKAGELGIDFPADVRARARLHP